jgi:hypothetical protein
VATISDRLELALDCVTDGRPSRVPRSLPTEEFTTEAFRAEAAAAAERAMPWTVGAGVQGVGIGQKVTEGQPTGDLALRVYVDRKRPKATIDNPVPDEVEVGDLRGVVTDVIAIGRVEAELFPDRTRPYMPGCGIGHPKVSAGTLGAFVRRSGGNGGHGSHGSNGNGSNGSNGSNELFALSNAHVLADDGLAAKGDPVLQPAADDGGRDATDTVALLEDFVPFEFGDTGFPNVVDAAIARIGTEQIDLAIRLLGRPPAGITTNVRRGMRVHKVGRTTDLTTGIVQDVHLRLSMTYQRTANDRGRVGFRDQVLCTRFTEGGDSGSLVLSSSNRAVGLHFAGSPSASVFNRIGHVLETLNVDLIVGD